MAARLDISDLSVSLADQDQKFTLSVPKLTLASGGIVGLTGSGGTGKTLLLEVLGLLRRPSGNSSYQLKDNGKIVDLTDVWDGGYNRTPETRAAHFGFVPQSGGLLPFLSVSENMERSQKIIGQRPYFPC